MHSDVIYIGSAGQSRDGFSAVSKFPDSLISASFFFTIAGYCCCGYYNAFCLFFFKFVHCSLSTSSSLSQHKTISPLIMKLSVSCWFVSHIEKFSRATSYRFINTNTHIFTRRMRESERTREYPLQLNYGLLIESEVIKFETCTYRSLPFQYVIISYIDVKRLRAAIFFSFSLLFGF